MDDKTPACIAQSEADGSNMRRVKAMLAKGVADRTVIAHELGITRKQVTSAIYNLQYRGEIEVTRHHSAGWRAGRTDSTYAVSGSLGGRRIDVLRGTSFIFNAGGKP